MAKKRASDSAKEAEEDKKDTVPDDGSEQAPKYGVIEPIAHQVQLKATHPNESYWRIGRCFTKGEIVEIPHSSLSEAQIERLYADPYLVVMPVTEG
ncbi:hypothetical protein A4G19_03735 [Pasteurellaceae bacterium Macca]|nr:hypothetical protein [Pasteurellaceae bacterium Macca]